MISFPPRTVQASDRMPETEAVDGVPRQFVRIDANGEVLLTIEGLAIQAADYIHAQFPDEDFGGVLTHYAKGLGKQLLKDGHSPSQVLIQCEQFVDSALTHHASLDFSA